jgi:hypothetical protein
MVAQDDASVAGHREFSESQLLCDGTNRENAESAGIINDETGLACVLFP